MSEAFLGRCKASLNNLIASEVVQESEDPYSAFSEGILNFYQHYCLDIHTSSWCHHEKVNLHMHNESYIMHLDLVT